ncbi:MAG: precorrin-6A/cobalt-precorrin-6A reductase [Clostridia bacterium]|jgi:precorrin-6A/cobalt-precorrin-6A reductase|nr:precorrin-6A/cobalt-precorrin-6A reductase [Clostridia bacterium]MDN5323939.1 precorrin-6A/cobalt-precorrin-6A reductase [Clostridia bacterium]
MIIAGLLWGDDVILILGGTLESRKLADFLKSNHYSFLISTVSQYGHSLAREVSPNVQRQVLDEHSLEHLCWEKNINTIIDATHPFATNISLTAIKVASKLNLNYLRLEREGIKIPVKNSLVHIVANSKEAASLAPQLGTRILLTIGSRQLDYFRELIKEKKVLARVLPEMLSLQKCLELGLQPKQIIAMQGPFSKEFNKALFKEKQVEVVITKNSGTIGGVDTKVTACLELNIPVIIIDKPLINYPRIAYEFCDVMEFLQEVNNDLSNKS